MGELLEKPVTKWMEEELKLRNLESLRLSAKAINMSEYVVDGRSLRGIINFHTKKVFVYCVQYGSISL